MGGNNYPCLNALKKYLEDESMDKKKQPFDTSDWTLECVKVRLISRPLTQINNVDTPLFLLLLVHKDFSFLSRTRSESHILRLDIIQKSFECWH